MNKEILYTIPLSGDFELRPLRWALGLSREELAVELGVSFNTIGRWERGVSSVNKSARKHLERLLRKFGITTHKFIVDPLLYCDKERVGKTTH